MYIIIYLLYYLLNIKYSLLFTFNKPFIYDTTHIPIGSVANLDYDDIPEDEGEDDNDDFADRAAPPAGSTTFDLCKDEDEVDGKVAGKARVKSTTTTATGRNGGGGRKRVGSTAKEGAGIIGGAGEGGEGEGGVIEGGGGAVEGGGGQIVGGEGRSGATSTPGKGTPQRRRSEANPSRERRPRKPGEGKGARAKDCGRGEARRSEKATKERPRGERDQEKDGLWGMVGRSAEDKDREHKAEVDVDLGTETEDNDCDGDGGGLRLPLLGIPHYNSLGVEHGATNVT